ncbi:hypothetical protein RJ640_011689 [Escallonia rubra]|uniref:Uncharacterized protein n=1 Tax=Escallonia rubra TaxID=112253 RepID=A0AA88U508_9ASTE|nr:hypothetical protein RJ640_011689 [Escallonia rubra]
MHRYERGTDVNYRSRRCTMRYPYIDVWTGTSYGGKGTVAAACAPSAPIALCHHHLLYRFIFVYFQSLNVRLGQPITICINHLTFSTLAIVSSPSRLLKSIVTSGVATRRTQPTIMLFDTDRTSVSSNASASSASESGSSCSSLPPSSDSCQRDRAAWLMRPKDTLVDTVAENLLDRLETLGRWWCKLLVGGGGDSRRTNWWRLSFNPRLGFIFPI